MADPRLPAHQAFNPLEETINIQVGLSKSMFHVHKTILCSSSKYFQARNKPEWSKSGAAIELPDHPVQVFSLYVNWLYAHKIPTARLLSHTAEANHEEWKTLACAYVLGEALIDIKFKDTIMDALRAKVRSTSGHTIWQCGGEVVKIIYDGTPESSLARQFFVDIYAIHAGEKEFALDLKDAPRDFFCNVLRALTKTKYSNPLNNFVGTANCKYHGHGNGEVCYLSYPGSM